MALRRQGAASIVKKETQMKRLMLPALLALAIGAVALAPVSAGADGGAVAAKKCKKGKKGAAAAKKGCKKKKKPATPPVKPPVTPTVRMTVTWNDTADLNLYAYSQDGTIAKINGSNPIPNTQFSANDTNGLGPETFSDLLSPSTREFSYVVCVGAQAPANGTIATLAYRRADGSTNSITTSSGDLDDPGDAVSLKVGNGFQPTVNPC